MSDERSHARDARLAELLSLPDDDPRRRELMRDPELRAAFDAYAAFMAADAPGGADVAGAERRLGAALDAEIFGRARPAPGAGGAADGARPRAGRDRALGWLTAPALRPALALGALALVAGAIYLGTRDDATGPIDCLEVVATGDVQRGGETGARPGSLETTVVAAGTGVEGARVLLAWPRGEAERWTIVLLTPAYEEIGRLGPFETPQVELDLSTLPEAAVEHAAIFWQVIDGDAGAPREGVGAVRLR